MARSGSVADTTGRHADPVLDELRDEEVVRLEPPVREALERAAPEPPSSRWRILAYKWFVLARRTD